MILHGDCLNELKTIPDNSVDTVITDPPYGYSFMGKDWDKAVPPVEIWYECLRVLKPGAFCLVMSAPRSDVQQAMTERLIKAGFRLDFTPIYWTYASGFPKAGNIGKLVDKRLGAEREVTGKKVYAGPSGNDDYAQPMSWNESVSTKRDITAPATPQARGLDGSYAGFQPKPAVEVVIVAMKPLDQKTYVDQALSNGHGVTWLDDGRIPTGELITNHARSAEAAISKGKYGDSKAQETHQTAGQAQGRFPANLLVSDDVLNDGRVIKSTGPMQHDYREQNNNNPTRLTKNINSGYHPNDSGSYSRYFDLDKWYEAALAQFPTFPFLIVPKASKGEKNKGLDSFEDKQSAGLPMRSSGGERGGKGGDGSSTDRMTTMKNFHPTVKPLKLMSYLVTLFSRPGDTVLDPFVGSGTTVVAAKQLGREGIGIEREAEYVEIARAREAHHDATPKAPEQVSLL